jgi:hypothetical protein
MVREMLQRAAPVTGQDVKQRFGGRRKTLDAQRPVDKNRRAPDQ